MQPTSGSRGRPVAPPWGRVLCCVYNITVWENQGIECSLGGSAWVASWCWEFGSTLCVLPNACACCQRALQKQNSFFWAALRKNVFLHNFEMTPPLPSFFPSLHPFPPCLFFLCLPFLLSPPLSSIFFVRAYMLPSVPHSFHLKI